MGAVIILSGVLAYVVVVSLKETAASRRWATRAKLAKARRVGIAELGDGSRAKLVGTVEYDAGVTVSAPYSDREGAAYEVVVDVKRGNSREDLAHRSGGVPFRIVDESGYAVVEPDRARFALILDLHLDMGGADLPPRAERFFEGHVRRYGRIREGVLAPGTRVAVLGYAAREPDPDGAAAMDSYRGAAPMRRRISGSRLRPILISNDPEALGE